MPSLCQKSAVQLSREIRKKQISPLELMQDTLERMDLVNPKLNAFIALDPERAMDRARVMTEAIARGKDLGSLAGIPLGVKDLEDSAGFVTSFGSLPFKDNIAKIDSTQVSRLKASGIIVVGKTNVPEFGFTGFTKNRLHGITRNPWNLSATPGGSSGGAAAAVAGSLVPLCTGSDAGGSIRIPASYSGCFGFKPSFGRILSGPQTYVSYSHMIVMGPLTRTVSDAALYLDCTAGHHPSDPYSLPRPGESFLDHIDELPKKLKIAFSPDLGYARVEKSIAACVEKAVTVFSEMGHTVELWPGALPDTGDRWTRLICTDIYSQLCRIPEKEREDIGRTLIAMVNQTRSLCVEDLAKIQQSRWTLNQKLMELFETFDLLLTPTMPTEAFAAGGPPPSFIDGEKVSLTGAVAFTYPFNLSGHPAASVPAGFSPNRLPVGLQIIGPLHGDKRVLQAARAFEKIRPWESPEMLTSPEQGDKIRDIRDTVAL